MNLKKLKVIIALIGTAALIRLIVFPDFWLSKEEKPYEPVTIYVGILLEEMNLDDLINESDVIVVGKVDMIYPGRWTTPDGKRPEGSDMSDFTIVTDINLEIAEVLKGNIEETNIRIRKFSGQVGQDSVIISVEETYELNQNYLLFLFEDTGSTANIEPRHYIAKGGAQGVYKINNGTVVPLHGSSDEEWNLEKLITYIETSLQQLP